MQKIRRADGSILEIAANGVWENDGFWDCGPRFPLAERVEVIVEPDATDPQLQEDAYRHVGRFTTIERCQVSYVSH